MPTFDVSPAPPTEVATDLLVLPVYQRRRPGPGVEEVQRALGVDLMATLAEHRVEGRVGDVFTVPTLGRLPARSLALVGVGPREEAGPAEVRRAAMRVARQATKFPTVAATLHRVGPDPEESAHAFAEGMVLGAYRFDRYKEKPIDPASREKPALRKVVALTDGERAAVRAGLQRGRIYAEAANWARDLVNTPAIDATPEYLARQARQMASRLGLRCKVWGRAELRRGGFGGILGVGAGSVHEPRLIELAYRGPSPRAPIAITGKGVTFDSGGLSLKDAQAMEWMKADMGGAAAALAAMRAVAELRPAVSVIAAIPCAENLPGGSAIRPGDVLHHRGGKTSEVLNTDAEGRLILADALAYLAEKKPRLIVDSATLTGAAMIALGPEVWAVIGTDRGLVDDLLQAGKDEGEPGWELPLWTDYRRHLESTVADVKNVGIRYGGAILAALFLREFVGDVPWAHLDVAGTAFVEHGNDSWPRGGTGSPARTLIRFIETVAAREAGERGAGRGRGAGRAAGRS